MAKYNYVPLVRIFTSFDWATGDILVDIMFFSKRNLGGKMEHGMLGQTDTVGKIFILPPKVFHFAPIPWSVLPNAYSICENFSDECD